MRKKSCTTKLFLPRRMYIFFLVVLSFKKRLLTNNVSDKYTWNFKLQVVLYKLTKVNRYRFIVSFTTLMNHIHVIINIKIIIIKDMVLGLFHQYGNDGCDRWNIKGLNANRVKNSSLWTVTIPHPKYSGRCFTYKYSLAVVSLIYI